MVSPRPATVYFSRCSAVNRSCLPLEILFGHFHGRLERPMISRWLHNLAIGIDWRIRLSSCCRIVNLKDSVAPFLQGMGWEAAGLRSDRYADNDKGRSDTSTDVESLGFFHSMAVRVVTVVLMIALSHYCVQFTPMGTRWKFDACEVCCYD